MAKMVKCKTCGADIATSAKTCPSCGAKNKQLGSKKAGLIVFIVFCFILLIGIIGSEEDTGSANNDPIVSQNVANNETATTQKTEFSGDCGISATAEMGSSIIGMPELSISIKNKSNKDISAIQFYVVPYDVYGDEITGWTSQNNLYTDTKIKAGKSNTISYQFIEDSVKRVRLYVYSVYFADGTEWGDKDATKSTILKYATPVDVYGES